VCPGTTHNGTEIEQPERYIVYILLSVFLGCNVLGLALTTFALPQIPKNIQVKIEGTNSKI
jgi:hypothetical protein